MSRRAAAALAAIAACLAGCIQPPRPPVTVRAVVEQSDDETLPWVSELHGLASLDGRMVDLDLTLPPAGSDGGGTGVVYAGAELRCLTPGPVPREPIGDFAVTLPAVARIDLLLGEGSEPVCTQRYDGLGIRFVGRYRVQVRKQPATSETPSVRLWID